MFAKNGKKHFSNTSCVSSSVVVLVMSLGLGALFGRRRKSMSRATETKSWVFKRDADEGDIMRENAGRGTCFRLAKIISYSSLISVISSGRKNEARESWKG